MKSELLNALDQIEKEKGISKEILFETIEAALITAYKKNFSETAQNVIVNMDRTTGEYEVFARYIVVHDDDFEDDKVQIIVEEAKKINPIYEIGDFMDVPVTPENFGRIAALTAKQVVVQRIREAERNLIFEEFSNRESEIVNGSVQRVSKGVVHINLGKTEAILLPSEQMSTDKYEQGARIKSFILEVKNTTKGPQVLVSRTHPGFIRRLFELEVPEIRDGIVEIRGISREAGSRTKLAVFSVNEDIDPVGSCVGTKGTRVQSIVEELNDEKIDIIEWSDDPVEYIANALRPSKVEKVLYSDDDKAALVVVPDYQLSLAIGKEGQNVRLAAKLTGWKIDIKSETQFKDAVKAGDIDLGEEFDLDAEFDFA
ncbi:MAG: transcription termination/antitermination protein NusA [Clostridiales bacterium]|nr:transcription termination/antitermination protein NusA [Clostridiales bacterium]